MLSAMEKRNSAGGKVNSNSRDNSRGVPSIELPNNHA